MTFNHGVRSSSPRWVTKRNKSELFRKSKLVRICFLLLVLDLSKIQPRAVKRLPLGSWLYYCIHDAKITVLGDYLKITVFLYNCQ